jgi:methyltransferase (TIGR00027 family)
MKADAPSATANVVAKNILMVAHTAELSALVPRDAARLSGWFVADFSPGGVGFNRRSTKRWFQSLRRLYERLTIPGLALHQALRKRYIEERVRAALAAGFRQLVVLGGGLDSLAVRLSAEFPEADFIELDHPATQLVKRRVIASRRLTRANLNFLPVDFTKDSWPGALLLSPAYQAERETIVLAEGVLMYLDGREVDAVFEFVRAQGGAKVRFVFTFMETDRSGAASFRRTTWLARAWLRLRGEPFKWGLHEKEMGGFLRERGFVLKELATSQTLREMYLRDDGLRDATLAEGETVCVCDVSRAP